MNQLATSRIRIHKTHHIGAVMPQCFADTFCARIPEASDTEHLSVTGRPGFQLPSQDGILQFASISWSKSVQTRYVNMLKKIKNMMIPLIPLIPSSE